MVHGWVPDREIGEVIFESFVYHIELVDGKPKFLVYHPYNQEFKVVGESAISPAVFTQQPVGYKKKIEAYKKLLAERLANA